MHIRLLIPLFFLLPALVFAQDKTVDLGSGRVISVKAEGDVFKVGIDNPTTCRSRSFLPAQSDPELDLEEGVAYNTFMMKQSSPTGRLFMSWGWADDALMTEYEKMMIGSEWRVRSMASYNGEVKKGDHIQASLVDLGGGEYHVTLAVTRGESAITTVTLAN